MANKGDVELVVRAKNEATKSLGAVADAIKELTQQNSELGKSAEKADGLIGALSREVRDLGKTAAGLTQFEKIASSLDRATAAVTRTEQAFARETAELGRVKTEHEAAAAATEKLKADADALTRSLDAQRQAFAASKTEMRQAAVEVQKLETALTRYQGKANVQATNADRKTRNELPGSTAYQSAGVFLTGQLEAAKARSQAAVQAHEANSRGLADVKVRQDALTVSLSEATSQETKLGSAVESTTHRLEREAAALEKVRAGLAEVQAIAGKASGMLGGVDPTASAIAAARAQADAEAARLKAIISNREAQAKARPPLPTERTVAAQRDMQGQVRTLRQTYDDARQAAARLGAEVARTAEPTREQARELLIAKEAAAAAKAEWLASAEALSKFRRASAGGFQAFSVRNTPPPVEKAPPPPSEHLARVRSAEETAAANALPGRLPARSIAAQRELQGRVQVLRASYDEARQAAARLGAEVAGTAQPTKEQARDFEAAREAVARLKAEYLAGAEALSKFRGASAGSFGGFSRRNTPAPVERPAAPPSVHLDAIRSAEETAAANAVPDRLPKRTAASQRELQNRVQVLRFAYDEARQAAARLGAEVAGTAQPTREQTRDFDAAREAVARLKAEYLSGAEALSKFRGASTGNFGTFSRRNTPTPAAPAPYAESENLRAVLAAQENAQANAVPSKLPRRTLSSQRDISDRVGVLKAAYEEARQAAGRLGAEIARTAQPTQEQARDFERARQAVAAIKAEYLAGAEALSKFRGAASGSFQAFSRRATPAVVPAAPVADPAPLGGAGGAGRGAGDGLNAGAAGARSFKEALESLYGESRQSLSLMQRLRGEVLALAAGYVGVQAAIAGVKRVLDAFRGLEAVQNRLGAVFGGDKERVGKEIEFLQREAARLGIQFSTLADEYGKFNIAAAQANFRSQDTRTIFMAVAEAGRVNKLTNDQLSGSFLALTQMISKGKVQSEELRRQLGDRLPGAFSIFANALGITEAELSKMMENGELLASSDTLLKFAAELNKRFGPQLQESLKSTTTLMGQFWNNIEQAALRVAGGGFIDGFNDLLKAMNSYFTSDEGRAFFLSIGKAAGEFFKVLAKAPEYFGLMRTAAVAWLALKLAPAFGAMYAAAVTAGTGFVKTSRDMLTAKVTTEGLTGSQRVLAASTLQTTTALRTWGLALTVASVQGGIAGSVAMGLAGAMATLRGVAVAVGATLRGLFALLGGVPGIIMTGLTLAAGAWLTSIDSATEALDKHQGIVNEVVAAYDRAKDKTGDWAKAIKGASSEQIKAAIRENDTQLNKVRGGLVAPQDYFGNDKLGTTKKVAEAIEAFKVGSISAVKFKETINGLAEADPKLDKNLVKGLLEAADKGIALESSTAKLNAALAVTNGTATEAQRRLLGTSDAMGEAEAKTRKLTFSTQAYGDALDVLKGKIPTLAAELKKLKDLAEIDTAGLTALAQAFASGDGSKVMESLRTYSNSRGAVLSAEDQALLKELGGGSKISMSTFKEIKGSEGFRSEAYRNFPNEPWTIGYGSTTVNGKPVQPGQTIDKRGAMEQAISDLQGFAAQLDAVVKVPLNENQRNALLSYLYNVGSFNVSSKSRAIVDRLNEKDYDGAADAIKNGVNTQNGQVRDVLVRRRAYEADLFRRPVEGEPAATFDQTKAVAEEAEKKRQKILDNEKRLDEESKRRKFDTGLEGKEAREAAILTKLYEEQNKAKEAGTELGKERIAQIREEVGALYDAQHVNEKAKDQEEKVNALYKLRQALLEEYKLNKERGDYAGAAQTADSLEKTNAQLKEAIGLAIQYWKAIGGTEADTAIAKLRVMDAQASRAKTTLLTAGQANEMLANGMVQAFDASAQGIGKAIVGAESWGEAIKGVGMAFLNFAADFLMQIAKMILKQMILNALQSAMGSGGGGGGGIGAIISSAVSAMAGAPVAVAHTGGIVGTGTVGSGNGTRMVSAAMFANALRYHTGGVAGLKPDEVPTILRRNEEVLTEQDPRHRNNLGGDNGGAAGPQAIRNVMVFDEADLAAAMSSSAGEKVVLSFVKKNRNAVKEMLK